MVTVIQLLSVEVKLAKLLVALVEVEVIETLLAAVLAFEVDDALSVVEPRLVDAHVLESLAVEVVLMLDIDAEKNIGATAIVELDDVLFVCVWARATDPELNDKRRTRKAMVMRMHMLICLPKAATFTRNRLEPPSELMLDQVVAFPSPVAMLTPEET